MAAKTFLAEQPMARLVRAVEAAWQDPDSALHQWQARVAERVQELKNLSGPVVWLGAEVLAADWQPSPAVLQAGPYGAVVCAPWLSVVEQVPLVLSRARSLLAPDGVLLVSMLGLASFQELQAAWAQVLGSTPHVGPFTDVATVGRLLQRLDLALPVVDRDVVTLTFSDMRALWTTLRALGVRNVRADQARGLVTPRQWAALEETYGRLWQRSDGRLPLTVELLYAHGVNPGPALPKAARRGSAKMSLVTILEPQE